MRNHTLTLEPVRGKTLAEQTFNEFVTGHTFKVAASTIAKFRRGDRVTYTELSADEHWHDVQYSLSFNILTVAEYARQRAETDYEFATSQSGVLRDLITDEPVMEHRHHDEMFQLDYSPRPSASKRGYRSPYYTSRLSVEE